MGGLIKPISQVADIFQLGFILTITKSKVTIFIKCKTKDEFLEITDENSSYTSSLHLYLCKNST